MYTSWKKLLSGYKLLKAVRKQVAATASVWLSVKARSKDVKISFNAQTTQGSPTCTCFGNDLISSSRNRLKCHNDYIYFYQEENHIMRFQQWK